MSNNQKIAFRAFSWPVAVTLTSLIPGINLLLFGHAGIGSILIFVSFPWFLIQLLLANRKIASDQKKAFKRFAVVMLISYLPVAFLLAMVGTYGILSTELYGHDFWRHTFDYWQALLFPFLFYTLFRTLFPS